MVEEIQEEIEDRDRFVGIISVAFVEDIDPIYYALRQLNKVSGSLSTWPWALFLNIEIFHS